MAQAIRQRHTAYKLWISDIINSQYVKQEGWDPNYIQFSGKEVSRVNILATVVAKFLSEDGNYGAITLDDGTETIRSKAFGPDVLRIKDLKVGALIRFIGKVKQYNDETYLAPEVARVIDDPNWIIVQQLELGKPQEVTAQPEEHKSVESQEKGAQESELVVERITFSNTAKIHDILKSKSKEDGLLTEELIKESGLTEDEAKQAIVELLKDGEIYEPKKGLLKVLD